MGGHIVYRQCLYHGSNCKWKGNALWEVERSAKILDGYKSKSLQRWLHGYAANNNQKRESSILILQRYKIITKNYKGF